ncbi:multiple sugar transport system permease protein [Friedmanniella endophytica]|uniref:Multiple sugar transport system permease protein n=1 Tax=Microlunatus kandeliicorticis TaxID=1759536 RepID=A0A7W3INR4_9ACTN|nr:sugar ABC transporter permease [Microlunatus kandeliicorticis]MBA8792442.1 multiple sugar transport system permease protein [Microlunatus kandeliicorticis]
MSTATAGRAAAPLAGPDGGPATRPRRRGDQPRSLTHRPLTGLLLVTPAVLFVLVLVFVPLLAAIGISLTNFPLIGSYRFIGLRNYLSALTDPAFGQAILYTLLYTAIVTGPILVLGYLLAVMIRANRRWVKVLRTVLFIPYVVGLSTLSFLLVLEAQPGSGAVNVVLQSLGITDGQTAWLVDGPLATALICVLVVWGVSGLTMVLLMSGMQGIPTDVYESAELDGAGWWRTERYVTLPLLRRTIALSVIISVIGSFLAFTQFFILTQGGPGSATTTVVMAIYKKAFVQLQLGAATAMSLLLVIIIGLVTAVQFWLLRERD